MSRIVAQLLIAGGQIFARAFAQAYRQAAASLYLFLLVSFVLLKPRVSSFLCASFLCELFFFLTSFFSVNQTDAAKGGGAAAGAAQQQQAKAGAEAVSRPSSMMSADV